MKITTPTLALTLLTTIGSFLAPHAQASLILNGSFESPGFTTGNAGMGREQYAAPSTGITNWTVTGAGDVYIHKTPDLGDLGDPAFNFAEDGNYYLDLSGSYLGGAHATIYQDFATIPANSYQLSFYIGAADITPPAATINVQLTGTASLLNTTLTPAYPSTNINWTLETLSFVADSETTRLSFTDTSALDDNSSFVDSVSIVPEPASGILLLFGAAVCCRRRSLGTHGSGGGQ